jgi:hypothetical protein
MWSAYVEHPHGRIRPDESPPAMGALYRTSNNQTVDLNSSSNTHSTSQRLRKLQTTKMSAPLLETSPGRELHGDCITYANNWQVRKPDQTQIIGWYDLLYEKRLSHYSVQSRHGMERACYSDEQFSMVRFSTAL